MRATIKTFLLVPALVLAAGCNKDKPVDSSLNNDLSLAGQVNPTARLDSISAAERANSLRAAAPAAAAPAAATHRTTTARRSTASSARRSSGTVTEQRTVTEKNTKRDAAIGAAAGAVLGATTSHDKLKGGIVGAAVGGILGGVIGNNVDIKKKKVP
jgi:uncharacterized protein YcfJ